MSANGQRNLSMESYPIEAENSKGYTLSWKNLTYTINIGKDNEKEILHGLTGIVKPGSVVAVIGPSGAGKSSFLDALAGRKPGNEISGKIAINGRTNIPIKHVSRYCVQEEALFGNLTVFETLMYAADFNLSKSTPSREKKLMVREILEKFGLTDVRNTIIGTPLRKGCSGGQVRRVSVASQVLGFEEGILFLDEPTSGLDSVAAEAIISSVCGIARKFNISVIATIHQPNTGTFALFSHLLILGNGRTIYFGNRESAIGYFDSIGYPIPIRSNPSDVYLQLTNVDFMMSRAKGLDRVIELARTFHGSALHQSIVEEIKEIESSPRRYVPGSVGYDSTFLYQTWTITSRGFLNAFKNPLSYWIRVAMYVALAVLMGSTWFRMDLAQTTVADRLAGIFFGVAFLSFMAVAGIPAFLEERHVFIQENANGLYGVGPYVISNLIVSIPFVFIITISFSGVAYFMMGLQESTEKFATFAGILFLSLMIAEAQTVFISVAIPIFVAALAVTAFTNGLWMVVQGFFVQKKNIPDFWRYSFHQIDFQKYAYELLITNEMTGLKFECDEGPGGCACIIPPKNLSDGCSFTGNDVLAFYDYNDVSYSEWLGIMAAIFVIFKLATFFALMFYARKKKSNWESENMTMNPNNVQNSNSLSYNLAYVS